MTTAKIATSSRVLNVGAAALADATGEPGQVLSCDSDGLVVACGTGAVRLSRLTCQEKGGVVNPADVKDTHLPGLDAREAQSLSAALAAIAPREAALRRALKAMDPVALAGARPASAAAEWSALPLVGELAVLGLAALRALGATSADIAFGAGAGLDGYLSDWVPLQVSAAGSLVKAKEDLAKAIAQAGQTASFALDIMTRDATLQGLVPPQLGLSTHKEIAGTVVTLTPQSFLLMRRGFRLPMRRRWRCVFSGSPMRLR